jgi:hypothetical protein
MRIDRLAEHGTIRDWPNYAAIALLGLLRVRP